MGQAREQIDAPSEGARPHDPRLTHSRVRGARIVILHHFSPPRKANHGAKVRPKLSTTGCFFFCASLIFPHQIYKRFRCSIFYDMSTSSNGATRSSRHGGNRSRHLLCSIRCHITSPWFCNSFWIPFFFLTPHSPNMFFLQKCLHQVDQRKYRKYLEQTRRQLNSPPKAPKLHETRKIYRPPF